jgi:hypothetical protein
MKRAKIVWLMVVLALAVTAYMAFAQEHTYVGDAKCKMCHKLARGGEVWQVWEASKHAVAFASLDSTKDQTKDPICLKCHTTGYDQGGYQPSEVDIDLKNVQCEACHGPASDYLRTHNKPETVEQAYAEGGLLKPNEETCIQCHNDQNPNQPAEPWDYAKMWAKIKHGLPAKAETE